jgi:hypothetical protein
MQSPQPESDGISRLLSANERNSNGSQEIAEGDFYATHGRLGSVFLLKPELALSVHGQTSGLKAPSLLLSGLGHFNRKVPILPLLRIGP